VGVTLDLDAIPLMQGALALSASGVRSSLFADNRIGAGPIEGPVMELLFDPQTAGGLLAAVAPASADATLRKLHNAGYTASIIGEITADQVFRTQ
jgi:selenide,water dikinase